jgi:undecaprenyl-diphosphatase
VPRRSDLAALIHGPAELLPVSSSAHAELLGDRESATGAHLGSALATLLVAPPSPRRLGLHLLAGAIPSVVGWRLRGRTWSPVPGLLLGSVALAMSDGRGGDRPHDDAGPLDGAALGLAQACALLPGVSRLGATICVARWRGFRDPARLAREVGIPVSLGAAVVGGRPTWRQSAVAFAATAAALPLLRWADRVPLRVWALYRCGLALALVRGSRR